MPSPAPYPFHRRKPINWRGIAVAVGIALSAPLVMGAVSYVRAVWAEKESATDHAADIAAVRAMQQRLLDVVCIDHAQARQCRTDNP